MQFNVSAQNIGERLDVFLTSAAFGQSRSQWRKKIMAGEVLVNGQRTSVHYFLNDKDIIKVNENQLKPVAEDDSAAKLIVGQKIDEPEIIFENNDYVIVNKPAGMLVHSDGRGDENTLSAWLAGKYDGIKQVGEPDRQGIVHRLDRDVSGVMVAALNQKTFDYLKEQFKKRRVKKEYIALVHNVMRQDEGIVKLPIARSKSKGIFVALGDVIGEKIESRRARTKYEVEKRFINYTLVKVRIYTGRTHQIRVHLRSIGHAIVGDKIYMTRDIRHKKKKVALGRLWLYAARLGFYDLSGGWREYEASRPVELEDFLQKIK